MFIVLLYTLYHVCSFNETIPMKVCEPYELRKSIPIEGRGRVAEQSTDETTVHYEVRNPIASTTETAVIYETIVR